MEPAPSVACLRQRLQSCAKRAGGGLAYHQGKRGPGNPPPRAATRQTWLRDGVAAGAAWVITQALACCKCSPHRPGERGRALARRGMAPEDGSLCLRSLSVGCKLTADSDPPVVRLASPWTLFARFQHLSQGCHRCRGTPALHSPGACLAGVAPSGALVPPWRGPYLAGGGTQRQATTKGLSSRKEGG
jgi:hypothetical protein